MFLSSDDKEMSWLVIGGSAAIAIYLVTSRKDEFFADANKDFREGYTAGFFTPGPFTVLAIAGLVASRF